MIRGPDRHHQCKKEQLDQSLETAHKRVDKKAEAVKAQQDKVAESEAKGHGKRLEQRQRHSMVRLARSATTPLPRQKRWDRYAKQNSARPSPLVETKIASLSCHRTQIDPNGPFPQLPEDTVRDIMRTEYYTLISPRNPGKDVDLLSRL